jgi:hypothetical protein
MGTGSNGNSSRGGGKKVDSKEVSPSLADAQEPIIQGANPSSCTETQNGVTCEIYISEESLAAIDDLIDGARWAAHISYAISGGLIGMSVGGIPGAIIGTVLFSVAGMYDVSILESVRTEIHDSVKNGVPLIVAPPTDKNAVGVVVHGGDGKGPLVNTPVAFFTLNLLVTLATGTSIVPSP